MRNLVLTGSIFLLLAPPLATPAIAMKPDLPQRMFPTFAGPLPANCDMPVEAKDHAREATGATALGEGAATTLALTDLSHDPFDQLLCSSAILQAHYVRRERRSRNFSMWLDIGTLAAATVGAGLVAFGGSAKAILAAGLTGGAIAVGRGYKSPEARQILYQKGEAALQCMDRVVVANDAVFAKPVLLLPYDVPSDDDGRLTQLETSLLIVTSTPGDDAELAALREAAKQALVALKSLRSGHTDLVRGYQNIAATIMTRYQNTRAPLDFGRAMDTIKQDIGQAQGAKTDAQSAAADLAKSANKDGAGEAALTRSLAGTSVDQDFKSMNTLKPIILQFLTSRYDSIRTLRADVTVCETIASI
jgi:hypothetical protein